MDTNDYLLMHEVAEIVRTPINTLRYGRTRGEGPESFKLGRRVLYDRADVEAWIERQRQTERER